MLDVVEDLLDPTPEEEGDSAWLMAAVDQSSKLDWATTMEEEEKALFNSQKEDEKLP